MSSRPLLVSFFWFACIVLEARPAHAYLDPGTGSALVCVLVSVTAAFAYMFRSVIYTVRAWVRRKEPGAVSGAVASPDREAGIVLFSEGRDYWLTFQPIIEALLRKNVRFRYLSMDVEDPALAIDDPRMDSRYIGCGPVSYARVAAVRGSVMLSTTPNIGCPDFPVPKPSRIGCLVHVLHGCCDITYYRRHSLDYYDAVFILGPAMEKSIRRLEEVRGLAAKECIVAGTPNLDAISRAVRKDREKNARPVVVLAPTWGKKGFLRRYGADFIEELAKSGRYELILRPHPQSWRKEARFMRAVVDRFSRHDCFRVDRNLSPSESFERADVLVSDISGVRFEFAFLYERPVITLASEGGDDSDFEAADLEWSWERDAEREIGPVIGGDGIGDMRAVVEKALAVQPVDLAAVRARYVGCMGRSGEVIADWLAAKPDSVGA